MKVHKNDAFHRDSDEMRQDECLLWSRGIFKHCLCAPSRTSSQAAPVETDINLWLKIRKCAVNDPGCFLSSDL